MCAIFFLLTFQLHPQFSQSDSIEMGSQKKKKTEQIHKQNGIFMFSDDWFRLLMWFQAVECICCSLKCSLMISRSLLNRSRKKMVFDIYFACRNCYFFFRLLLILIWCVGILCGPFDNLCLCAVFRWILAIAERSSSSSWSAEIGLTLMYLCTLILFTCTSMVISMV